MNTTSQQRVIGSDSKMEVYTDMYCMDELKTVSELRVKNNASDVVVNTLNNAGNLYLDYGNKYRGGGGGVGARFDNETTANIALQTIPNFDFKLRSCD